VRGNRQEVHQGHRVHDTLHGNDLFQVCVQPSPALFDERRIKATGKTPRLGRKSRNSLEHIRERLMKLCELTESPADSPCVSSSFPFDQDDVDRVLPGIFSFGFSRAYPHFDRGDIGRWSSRHSLSGGENKISLTRVLRVGSVSSATAFFFVSTNKFLQRR